jgi:aminoglycoside phosphotransferase (APT) family kinase protein
MDKGRTEGLLRRAGLIGPEARIELMPLTGGVSSDVWRATDGFASFCVKAALPELKTKARWEAPIGRALAERNWLDWVGKHFDGFAPRILAFDAAGPTIVMDFLDPSHFRNWKSELMDGRVDTGIARQVGSRLARIHAASVCAASVPASFANDADFDALRIDPYFRYTAAREPTVAPRLLELVSDLEGRREALVHGDVSPKNILCGPDGPVFIDAECATFGDPAFDIAFCLNHILIKSMVMPDRRGELNRAALELWEGYAESARWPGSGAVELRCTALLPALMLARVSGKSPLEYLDESGARSVRSAAIELLGRPACNMTALARFVMEYDR